MSRYLCQVCKHKPCVCDQQFFMDDWDVEDEPDFDDDELGIDPEEREDEDG